MIGFLLLELLILVDLLPNVLVDHAAAVQLRIGLSSRNLRSSLSCTRGQLFIGVELLKLVSQVLLRVEMRLI